MMISIFVEDKLVKKKHISYEVIKSKPSVLSFQQLLVIRYFGTRKRTNYLMDEGAGTTNDFRYYNYRKVPYMGGSDEFK